MLYMLISSIKSILTNTNHSTIQLKSISNQVQIKIFVRVPNQTSTYFINCTKHLSSDQDQIWAHEHGI